MVSKNCVKIINYHIEKILEMDIKFHERLMCFFLREIVFYLEQFVALQDKLTVPSNFTELKITWPICFVFLLSYFFL